MQCKECKIKYEKVIAGQAFTKYICEKCGQIAWYHNTLTPKYCTTCCEEDVICEYCGKSLLIEAILEQKEKRSLYDIALDIDISESSLYKYITTGSIGDKVLKKIRKWYKDERRF